MSEVEPAAVLVAEDDSLTRKFIGHALATTGLRCVEVTRGDAALAAIRGGEDFAVAILDGLLPDMHGWALADQILSEPNGAQLPLLFVTGALRRPVPARAGIDALMKPIGVVELVTHVRALLDWRTAGGSQLTERHAVLADLESGFLIGP